MISKKTCFSLHMLIMVRVTIYYKYHAPDTRPLFDHLTWREKSSISAQFDNIYIITCVAGFFLRERGLKGALFAPKYKCSEPYFKKVIGNFLLVRSGIGFFNSWNQILGFFTRVGFGSCFFS